MPMDDVMNGGTMDGAAAVGAGMSHGAGTYAGTVPPSPAPAMGEWPLRFEPFDMRPRKQRGVKATIMGTAVIVVPIALGAAGIAVFHSGLMPLLSLLVLIIGLCGIPTIVTAFRDTMRTSRLPDGGFQLTEQAILNAYGTHGLAEIRLSTPAIDYDNGDDDEYTVRRNGFDALWLYDATDDDPAHPVVRSYTLWWRDDAWPNLKRLKVDGDEICDVPKSDEIAMIDAPDEIRRKTWYADMYAERWRRFLDAGVDLRMWPCVLEVRGRRARLMFDPNAAKTVRGPADPNIKQGIDKVYRLADTFPQGAGGR